MEGLWKDVVSSLWKRFNISGRLGICVSLYFFSIESSRWKMQKEFPRPGIEPGSQPW
jgi:hypothetical protein